jgi:uncharacterized damage-inducible protein DinB
VTGIELLTDAFERIRDLGHAAVEDLTVDQLNQQVSRDANTVSWLVWHLIRVQDDHVAEVAGTQQRWTAAGWAERFDLPFGNAATGYGHSAEQVTQVKVASAELLTGYLDDVTQATLAYLRSVSESDLDRLIDEAYDPPVTLGVRLLSVVGDDLQHVGQAAFARGIISV